MELQEPLEPQGLQELLEQLEPRVPLDLLEPLEPQGLQGPLD